MISLAQAKRLLKLAKQAILLCFENKKIKISDAVKEEFDEKKGVFVSLYVKNELIGCIGFPMPIMPLYKAVVDAALKAAFEDPRFPPLQKNQIKDLRTEISVLTEPEEIEIKDAKEYLEKIKIGRDGLMVKDEFGSGLLLPQVAVEWDWDAKEFLNQTCRKAGLSPDCWNNLKRNVYKFQAQVFSEEKGKTVEKKIY